MFLLKVRPCMPQQFVEQLYKCKPVQVIVATLQILLEFGVGDGEFAKIFSNLQLFYSSGGATFQNVEGVRYCHNQVKSWCDCQGVGEEAGTMIININIF